MTIRNVPDDVRNELASRAARNGQSLQEYVLSELVRLASKPDNTTWVARARERVEGTGLRVAPETILRWRDEGRAE